MNQDKRLTTLVFLITEKEICLGKKKRGFGEGLWNGYGGKVEAGERIEVAALRELKEESGVGAEEAELQKRGVIEFFFEDGLHIETHVFFLTAWSGIPFETDEMLPRWFSYDAIPYASMWQDDVYWLPQALAKKQVGGKVWFGPDGAAIKKMEWDVSEERSK